MENIRLTTKSGSSSVVYVRDNFEELHSMLSTEKEVVVIIDKNVEALFGNEFNFKKIVIEVSEQKKTLETVSFVIEELLKAEVGRDCLLLGIGGGITTDIIGFVASIYKRGVRFAYVATSLLSQVDASFGGKNGVNFKDYKNIIGTINQSEYTFINISVLKTLPKREFLSGVAEMVKVFTIADYNSYRNCVDFFKNNEINDSLLDRADLRVALSKLIASAIKIKCWIVEKDELEKGERRLLNLGHTFGHAIEKCSMKGCNILHGEAISIGMVIAAKISNNIGLLLKDNLTTLINDLKAIGLPISTNIPLDQLLSAIKNDKKREGESIHLVLVQNIGQSIIKKVTIKELEDMIYDLY